MNSNGLLTMRTWKLRELQRGAGTEDITCIERKKRYSYNFDMQGSGKTERERNKLNYKWLNINVEKSEREIIQL